MPPTRDEHVAMVTRDFLDEVVRLHIGKDVLGNGGVPVAFGTSEERLLLPSSPGLEKQLFYEREKSSYKSSAN